MRSRRRVILATRNPGKLRELKAVLTEAEFMELIREK